ncbi:aflatoxin biosynthesis ketoreductase-like protein nor-1 [Cladochytrium replicatum]|nr:aflatoxin biosynthesis ketoreductase-like protein nor-1 [Cladochytrium replicatum]
MSSLVYLISGANRGIGLSLTESLLSRPNTTVIAAVRDPLNTSTLTSLQLAPGSRLITVKIVSTSENDALEAVQELTSRHGIDHIDIVIANAGISKAGGPIANVPAESMREHWEINTLGPLLLFQATWPLLQKSKEKHPKFVGISTLLASVGTVQSYPATAYGSSKAAFNYIVRKIQVDHGANGLISFAIHPGWVASDMGNEHAQAAGLESAPVSLKDSVAGLLDKIDNATTETFSKLIAYDGEVIQW